MTQLMFNIVPHIKQTENKVVLHSINRRTFFHNWFLIILESIIISPCMENSHMCI